MYFLDPRKGWEEVIEKYPQTLGDIEEARKCYALGRYPAAVFHSLQVVEIGIIDLGKIVNSPDPLAGWTATDNALKAILKKNFRDRTSFEQENSAFLEQIQATIESLKSAWRNKISHAHGKLILLRADFNSEIAEEILFASRSFMRRLATDVPRREAQ